MKRSKHHKRALFAYFIRTNILVAVSKGVLSDTGNNQMSLDIVHIRELTFIYKIGNDNSNKRVSRFQNCTYPCICSSMYHVWPALLIICMYMSSLKLQGP